MQKQLYTVHLKLEVKQEIKSSQLKNHSWYPFMSVHYTRNGISVSHAVCSAVHCTLYVLCSVHTEKLCLWGTLCILCTFKSSLYANSMQDNKRGIHSLHPDGRIFLLLRTLTWRHPLQVLHRLNTHSKETELDMTFLLKKYRNNVHYEINGVDFEAEVRSDTRGEIVVEYISTSFSEGCWVDLALPL